MGNSAVACARRMRVIAAALAAGACWFAGAAAAQGGWKPAKPVEFVNPAAPGGSVDLMIRLTKKFAEDTRCIVSYERSFVRPVL